MAYFKGDGDLQIDADHISGAMQDWLEGSFTKVCVSVNSEQELLAIYEAAIKAGLPCSLIKDAGHTEFKEPTLTCCAIGPAYSGEIDKITGALSLL
jgi:peptidyl-tRNA hydrolase, PTH2 family